MKTFKQRQIDIKKDEDALHDATQSLLVDIISELTEEQLSSLTGYDLSEYETITQIDSYSIYVDDGDIEPVVKEYDDLSQVEQKQLIDYIMFNVLKQ